MVKMNKFQLVKAAVLLLLLLLIPFVSSSMRPSYLYFLLNILILSLGIESGFLAVISKPRDDKKPPIATTGFAPFARVEAFPQTTDSTGDEIGEMKEVTIKKKQAAVAEKIALSAAMVVNRLKKCPSVPSLFFIGSYEIEEEEEMMSEDGDEEDEEIMVGELGSQPSALELFSKAEMFISNFYKQLKSEDAEGRVMEDNSWLSSQGILVRKL